ncbi:hypothetical protein NBO_55g0008 [Nosema bombycis CQ1]|uniref:Uncharacterized protein n=1 Tax=Nosema bombycis (strain CQ1 / CVCC 102059) TaxID=578461 RepID=R0MLY2_NOSB1|nr:hypothetical protein NBO_55g0008 [Nosema bombycis CQ1]|eukprot:EOB13843.1 hypothetical protein NBO_55g0008 [Nosema bombycis CQ1]
MKFIKTNKLNLKKPPVAQFNANNKVITVTKGRFINIQEGDNNVVVDVTKNIHDCCIFNDKIFVISKKGELFKVTDTVEQIKFNLNSSTITHNNKNLIIGTQEGKVTVLSENYKPLKNYFLLTETICRLETGLKNYHIANCVNSPDLNILNLKKNEKYTINIKKGASTAFDLFNKRHVVVGTEDGFISLVSLETLSEVTFIRIEHPISFIKCSTTHAFVGTTSGVLVSCEITTSELEIVSTEDVPGVVNGINISNNKIVVLCGREEAKTAFYKNKKFKNAVINFTIKN